MKMIKKIAVLSAFAMLTAGVAFASGKKDSEAAKEAAAKITEEAKAQAEETTKDAANEVTAEVNEANEKIQNDVKGAK